jgi:hypothetical protein
LVRVKPRLVQGDPRTRPTGERRPLDGLLAFLDPLLGRASSAVESCDTWPTSLVEAAVSSRARPLTT